MATINLKPKEKIKVGTSIEFNVEEKVKSRLESAIKQVVDECSEEYLRNINVEFSLEIK